MKAMPEPPKTLADLQAEAFFGFIFWGTIAVLFLFGLYEILVKPLIDLDPPDPPAKPRRAPDKKGRP